MKRFKDILCIEEPGKECKPALERAVTLAENNQANLTVITVATSIRVGIGMPEDGPSSTELQATIVNSHKQELENLVEPYRQRIKIETRVLIGVPFLEIIREVLRNAHDLVIKCPESLDWLGRLFSSNDKHLLRKCPCPVWMVRPQTGEAFDRILAAVDVDDAYPAKELKTRQVLNEMVIELASSLAVSEFAELHIAHAWEAIGESKLRHSAFMQRPENEVNAYVDQTRRHHTQLLDTLVKKVSAKLGKDAADYIEPQIHMPKGSARKMIPKVARELQVDCIVMGTVARTGVSGLFMGNTAETILDQLECSVLAIKPPGFVTPVTLEE
ncbi:MAG: universal stress protein [Gammaproteobacteria bacterium]|jgi:nucleotide-binding universal stress UspA family protein